MQKPKQSAACPLSKLKRQHGDRNESLPLTFCRSFGFVVSCSTRATRPVNLTGVQLQNFSVCGVRICAAILALFIGSQTSANRSQSCLAIAASRSDDLTYCKFAVDVASRCGTSKENYAINSKATRSKTGEAYVSELGMQKVCSALEPWPA